MLRFKQLHYGKLFPQRGKGRKDAKLTKILVPQQGGAMGFDGVDYPDPNLYNHLDSKDYNTMLKFIKSMYKIISKQPDADSNKWVKGLIEDYKEVEDGGFDNGDVSQLYSDWQGYFTEDSYKGDLVVPAKAKSAPKASAPKASKAPAKDMKDEERKISAKMAHYRMILMATSKKFMALKSKDRTPEINKEMLALKAKNDKARKKYDYWKKRMIKVNPDHLTEGLNAQITECRDELKEVKNKLDESRIENSNLRFELEQCLDKKDPEKIALAKKGTISTTSSFKVAEVKPPEKPVDIDAELAKLEVMKKALVSPSLSSYTVAELKAIAKKEKSGNITGLKKKQLVQLIIDGRNAKKKPDVKPVKKSVPAVPIVPVVPAKPKKDTFIDDLVDSFSDKKIKIKPKKAKDSPVIVDITKHPIYIKNTVLQLKALCKDMGITGYGHKSKAQLAEMVVKGQRMSKKHSGSGKEDDEEDEKDIPDEEDDGTSILVRHPLKKIKDEINKNPKVYYWLIKGDTGSLVAKGMTDKEATSNLLKKIKEKPDKYTKTPIWKTTISIHDESKKEFMIFGEILVLLTEHEYIGGKIEGIKQTEHHHGPIWFRKEWLEFNGWDNTYLKNIVNYAAVDMGELKGIEPYIYHEKLGEGSDGEDESNITVNRKWKDIQRKVLKQKGMRGLAGVNPNFYDADIVKSVHKLQKGKGIDKKDLINLSAMCI